MTFTERVMLSMSALYWQDALIHSFIFALVYLNMTLFFIPVFFSLAGMFPDPYFETVWICPVRKILSFL